MKINDFEDIWVKNLWTERLKEFPDEFVSEYSCESIQLAAKPLLKGSELFGNYEIIDIDGNIILTTDNLDKVKYILYSNRNYPTSIKIPKIERDLKLLVREYEKHLDDLIKLVKEDFLYHFDDPYKFTSTINKIFQRLKLQRH